MLATIKPSARLAASGWVVAACIAAAAVPANAGDNLSVTEFGEWAKPGGVQDAAMHAAHTPPHPRMLTPANALPKSGSATYAGSTVGSAAIGGTPFFVTGTETLTARFGAASTPFGNSQFGTVAGSFNLNKTSLSGATTPFAIFSTGGPLVGTEFPILNAGGKAAFFNATEVFGFPTNSSNLLGGTVTGAFFGSTGQAIAGSWTLKSAGVVPPASAISAQGAFAAHR